MIEYDDLFFVFVLQNEVLDLQEMCNILKEEKEELEKKLEQIQQVC